MPRKNKYEIKIGLIRVSIIESGSQANRSFSIKLERLFKDGDRWRRSSRIDKSNLLVAAKALELAYEKTISLENEEA